MCVRTFRIISASSASSTPIALLICSRLMRTEVLTTHLSGLTKTLVQYSQL
jgi:hypothetical protein